MFHSWLQIYLVDIQISGSVVHLMVGRICLLNIYDIGEHGFNSCLCLPLPASLLEWRNKFSILQPILKYWPIIVVQTETYRPIYNTTEEQPYIEQAGVFVVKCVRQNICHFHIREISPVITSTISCCLILSSLHHQHREDRRYCDLCSVQLERNNLNDIKSLLINH